MKLVWKLTFPQICLLFCLFLISYTFIHGLFSEMLMSYVSATAGERIHRIHRAIRRSAHEAVRISSLFAELPVVRQAYGIALSGNIDDPYSPEAQAARELLRTSLKPLLDSYKTATGDTLKLHFHLPNCRSLVRLWRDRQTTVDGVWADISDDLSAFRPTIKDANALNRTVQGIEIGSGGMVVRGVVPLRGADGKPFGTVEVLLDFESALPPADGADTLELIYIKGQYLDIATALRDPAKAPRLGNFVQAATIYKDEGAASPGDNPAEVAAILDPAQLDQALTGQAVTRHGSLYLVAAPFQDYSGAVSGVLVCALRADAIIQPILEVVSILLAICMGVTLIFFILNHIILRVLVTRPINDVATQIDVIVSEESLVAKPIFYSSKDEIGRMVTKFNALVSKFNGIFDKMLQTQQGLRDARSQAEEHARAKSIFLANMSHEIRTPMNAVIGMTSIARSTDEVGRKNYCLEKISEASQHLLGVINDILDMSKIDAGKLELAPQEFSFSAMISRVLTVNMFRVKEKKQELTVDIDQDIPDVLVADEQRLGQVIVNLLSNAVKFTPEGGAVTLRAERLPENGDDRCTLRIAVKDTGIGISEEQQALLFQPFQQADASVSRKYGGTGLGLALSRRIVEMMGGRIWINSEVGKGSTFQVEVALPVGDAGVLHFAQADADRSCLDEKDIFCGKRLLLADDVEINQEIVKALLEKTGLDIDCAADGVEAVRKFQAAPQSYDLILMDIQMPEMDGYDATREIRDSGLPRADEIPIIAMTANVFREDIERCLASGMNGHVGKPISEAELAGALKTYLGGGAAQASSSQESSSSTL